MSNLPTQFIITSKTKMTNRQVTLRALWDALEGNSFPREYDGWTEVDQVNYERTRLNAVNILAHAGSVPHIENPRKRGHRSAAWAQAVAAADQAIGTAIPPKVKVLAGADALGL